MPSLLTTLDINNRDLSVALWLAILVAWAITNRSIRVSLLQIFKAMTARVVFLSLAVMLTYVVLLVYALSATKVWEIGNLKDTVIWFFATAFAMFVHVNRVGEERYFRAAVADTLKLAAILAFVLNLYVFSFWVELVLVPFLFLVGGFLGVATSNPKHRDMERLLNGLLAIMGMMFLLYTGFKIVEDTRGFLTVDHLRDFLIPVFLTIGFLPYIYALGLYVLYDSIFNRLGLFSSEPKTAAHARLTTFLTFRFNLSAVRRWYGGMGRLHLESKDDIVQALDAFRSKSA
ncbi:hypothetical protein ACFLWA_12860 [Chloroflexota bacterium]